jgi:hypothetical protein
MKKGDKVLYSPYIACDDEDKEEYILETDPEFNKNAGCTTVFLK